MKHRGSFPIGWTPVADTIIIIIIIIRYLYSAIMPLGGYRGKETNERMNARTDGRRDASV